MAGIAVSVAVGLAAGIGFIVLMSLAEFQTPIGHYTAGLIDDINPRFDIDETHRKTAVDTMLKNATLVEILEGRDVYISAISGIMDCRTVDCVRVYLWQRGDSGDFIPQSAQVMIDYSNQRVMRIEHTDGW